MAKQKPHNWSLEAELCADFIKWAEGAGWKAYPETGGFDIVLVRIEDGFQIGIEAKMSLNAKVLCQIIQSEVGAEYRGAGPDCYAVLVPENGVVTGLEYIAKRCGIVVIRGRVERDEKWNWKERTSEITMRPVFYPSLPRRDDWGGERWSLSDWPERFPDERVKLPDYVPDVVAGAPAPVQLTDWKVRAIKLVIILERWGSVTRADMKALKISPTRWCNVCLVSNGEGGWVVRQDGRFTVPDFRAQHPVNFGQIEADFEQWSKDLPARLSS